LACLIMLSSLAMTKFTTPSDFVKTCL